jgi:hypothetical protein
MVGIIHPKGIEQTKAYFKKNPDEFFKRMLRIYFGTEIPFVFVQKDLRDLFRCVRILEILKSKEEKRFDLRNGAELRRLMYASDMAPFVIPRGKDSGRYKELDPKWQISKTQKEGLVNNFASNVNRFIQPITRFPLQTEVQAQINQRAFGVETFLVYSILMTEGEFREKFCIKETCGRPFYAQRSSREYCSTECNNADRQKRYRANKKVSVRKNREKTTIKKGK